MPRRQKNDIHRGRKAGTRNDPSHKRGTGITLFTKPGRDAGGRLVAVYYGRYTFTEPATGLKVVKRRALKREDGEPITTRPEAEAALADFRAEVRAEYHLDERDEVKRKRAIAAAVKTAEEALREKQEADRLAQEARDALRIADAFARYRPLLALFQNRKGKVVDPATVDRYEAQFTAFENWIEVNHPEVEAVRDVSPALAQEWLDSLSALSGNSLNKRIVLMRSVWNLLKAGGEALPRNPWADPSHGGVIVKKAAGAVNKKPFTDEEVDRLLDLAEGEVRTLAFIAAFTGARLGDCVRFKWDMIDFKNWRIQFTPHKTLHTSGKEADLPLLDELAAHLKTLPGFALGRGYIVPTLCEEYEKDAPGFLHKRLEPLYAKAEIVTREEGPDGKLHTVRAWHSWRHYFATRCLQAGVAPADVQEMLGWTSNQLLKVYHNPDPKRILDRVNAAGAARKALTAPAKALPAPTSPEAALDALRAACDALRKAGASPDVWLKAESIVKNASSRKD